MRARALTIASMAGVAVLAGGALFFFRTRPRTHPVPSTPRLVPTARPAPALHWTSHHEEEWLVSEVARDILEMVAFAKSPSDVGKDGLPLVVRTVPGAEASYEIAGSIGPEAPPFTHRIILYDHVWSATNYESLARVAMERIQVRASANRPPTPARSCRRSSTWSPRPWSARTPGFRPRSRRIR